MDPQQGEGEGTPNGVTMFKTKVLYHSRSDFALNEQENKPQEANVWFDTNLVKSIFSTYLLMIVKNVYFAIVLLYILRSPDSIIFEPPYFLAPVVKYQMYFYSNVQNYTEFWTKRQYVYRFNIKFCQFVFFEVQKYSSLICKKGDKYLPKKNK